MGIAKIKVVMNHSFTDITSALYCSSIISPTPTHKAFRISPRLFNNVVSGLHKKNMLIIQKFKYGCIDSFGIFFLWKMAALIDPQFVH